MTSLFYNLIVLYLNRDCAVDPLPYMVYLKLPMHSCFTFTPRQFVLIVAILPDVFVSTNNASTLFRAAQEAAWHATLQRMQCSFIFEISYIKLHGEA